MDIQIETGPPTRRPSTQPPVLLYACVGAAFMGILLLAVVFVAWPGAAPGIRDLTVGSPGERAVRSYLEKNTNDPSKLEVIEIKKIGTDGGEEFQVSFRSTNGFGALVLSKLYFVVNNGEVVQATEWTRSAGYMREMAPQTKKTFDQLKDLGDRMSQP